MNAPAPLLSASFFGALPWAINSDAFASLMATIEAKAKISQLDRTPPASALERTSHKYTVSADGVATIPLTGVMLGDTDWVLDYFDIDYTVTPHLADAISEAAGRSDVRSLVIAADTPGGSVVGLEALNQAIANAGKPVIVAASGMLCSAGMYVASAADQIIAEPATIVGSIGTMTTITDVSALLAKLGVQVHLIASGPQKGTGTPGVPITDERKRPMQAIVDELAAQFKAAVTRGRCLDAAAVDRLATGEAWLAGTALTHGLIDAVTSTPLAAASITAKECTMLKKEEYKALIAAHPTHLALIDKLDDDGADEATIKAAIKDADHKATADKIPQLEAKLADSAKALKDEQDAHGKTKADLATANEKLAKIKAGQPAGDPGAGGLPPANSADEKTADELAAMSPIEQASYYAARAKSAKK